MNKFISKLVLLSAVLAGLSITSNADIHQKRIAPMGEKKIKKMDRKLSQHKAKRRNFKTEKDFERKNRRAARKSSGSYGHKVTSPKSERDRRHYGNNRDNIRHRANNRNLITQRGHRYPKRGWTLAYRYDRATFYDRGGYFYGYFNRHGYYFEDMFYRYDRRYTYRDRVKGRGLFDRKFYMPANARYYGFAKTHRDRRNYDRY